MNDNFRQHALAAILLAACLALPGWAQEKGKKPAEEKKDAAKAEKREERKDAAKAEKKVPGVLDQETRDKAAAQPELAELLALRTETDELWVQYRTLALTKGVKAHARALRELPGVTRQLEKSLEKLAALAAREIEPADKVLADAKEQEAKLLRRFDKLQDRGGDALRPVEKELDEIRGSIETATQTCDLLRAVGETNIDLGDPDFLLLEELLDPNEQEFKALQSLAKKDPELVEGRLMLLHMQADLQAAKEGTAEDPADPERAAVIERQLKQVEKKFAKYFLEVWQPIAEQDELLTGEKDELEEKLADAGDRPAAKKYQRLLTEVSNKLQGSQRTTALYRKIAKGTLADAQLAEAEKEKRAKEDDGRREDSGRKR